MIMNTKKYIQTDKLQSMIDWENIMKMERSAGGHDAQMIGLFKGARVLSHFHEIGYSGTVATCVQLSDGRFAVYNDYYGSCSGCDAWEDATDEEVKNMCINLSNGAYVFDNLEDVKIFLKERAAHNYEWDDCAEPLLKGIPIKL
jgi:hypothetical protein